MQAEIVNKKFFKCPNCGDYDFGINHLKLSSDIDLKWQCDVCATMVSFKLLKEDVVEINAVKTPPEGKSHLLVLLKATFQDPTDINPVYLILEAKNYSHEVDIKKLHVTQQYYYNEHTCPSNYLGGVTILAGDDDDPHGIFEFVEIIFRPNGFDSTDFHNNGGDYKTLFKSLCNPPINAIVNVDRLSTAKELTFGEALEHLKNASLVTRKGWVFGEYIAMIYVRKNPESLNTPIILKRTMAGIDVIWKAHSTDLFAKDWTLFDAD